MDLAGKGGNVLKIEMNYGKAVLNLPRACVPYLSEATADEMRVLLALGAENESTVESLSHMTGLSEERVANALTLWKKAGVLETEGEWQMTAPEKDTSRTSYTGEDMARIAETSDIKELVDVCAAILGKTFTPMESESLFYLHDGLRLEFEYIVNLCKHCYDIGKPSLRYIEKVGIDLYDRGITTVGALGAYIANEEKKNDTVDWNLPYEMIELGYNQMLAAIDKPKFSYENGILKKWVEAGCRTKEDAEAYLNKNKETKGKPKAKTENKQIGFDLDEFFAAATMRGEESSEN